jgi:hypothetical protein
MNHMKESLHSRLFSLGIVVMAVSAMVVGLWAYALVLVAALAAHEVVKHLAWIQDPAPSAPQGTGPVLHP